MIPQKCKIRVWRHASQLIWESVRIFKLLRSPRIDFKEPIPPGCIAISLAGRYDDPIPTQFLAPIDCLKVPTLLGGEVWRTREGPRFFLLFRWKTICSYILSVLDIRTSTTQFNLSAKNVHRCFIYFSVRIPSQLKPISALSVKA